jgi:hypothetical protein
VPTELFDCRYTHLYKSAIGRLFVRIQYTTKSNPFFYHKSSFCSRHHIVAALDSKGASSASRGLLFRDSSFSAVLVVSVCSHGLSPASLGWNPPQLTSGIFPFANRASYIAEDHPLGMHPNTGQLVVECFAAPNGDVPHHGRVVATVDFDLILARCHSSRPNGSH